MSAKRMLLKVFSKEVPNEKGGTFPVFFGYRVERVGDVLNDVATPSTDREGKAIMRSIPVKIKLTELFKNTYKDFSTPSLLDVNLEGKTSTGKKSAFITVDKDSNKKPRLDKNGKRHPILVIEQVESWEPLPYEDMDFDSIDNFE